MAYNEKIYKEYRSRQNTAAKNYESAKREMRKAQNDIKALDKELRDSYSFEKSKAYGAKREVLVERLGKNERLMKQNYKEARKWEKVAEAEQRKKAGNEKMAGNSLENLIGKVKKAIIKEKPKTKGR